MAAVRERVFGELETLRGFCRIPEAKGAFYALLEVDSPLDSLTVADRLIREHGVAVIPGNAFGLEQGCTLRIAYGALQLATVDEALRRLTVGLTAIVRDG
jgi:aspartate/methionine/tyrosine aminotransferase